MKPRVPLSLALGLCLLAPIGVESSLPPTPAAASVSLAWSASVTPGVTNYTLWWGTVTQGESSSMDVGLALTATVTGLARGQGYYFRVNCQDTNGDASDYSNEVYTNRPFRPSAPGTLTITGGQ